MALCETQLDSVLLPLKNDEEEVETEDRPAADNADDLPLPKVTPHLNMPLAVDYTSPRSHFIPPEVEMYSMQSARRLPSSSQESGSNTSLSTIESNASGVPAKRKRGRPRVDKTSPEYLAKSAARKHAKEMGAMINNSPGEMSEKRKRGRPRIDKTSPEYLARKRAKELEALEKRTRKQYKHRGMPAKVVVKKSTNLPKHRPVKNTPTATAKAKLVHKKMMKMPQKKGKAAVKVTRSTGKGKRVVIRRNSKFVKRKKDSTASSSAGDTTPRLKRKYTKRTPPTNSAQEPPGKRGRKKKVVLGIDGQPVVPSPSEKTKGKRGRPRKSEINDGYLTPNSTPKKQQPLIRVRSNLMPANSEPISVDSDEDVELGSPGHSDSLSLDENLRALRHLHEKYANIGKDDLYEAHLLAANFKKPSEDRGRSEQDEVVSLRSTPARDSVKHDSDNSSSDDSSSSGSSSSSSSGSSSSSDSSDSESEADKKAPAKNHVERLSMSPTPQKGARTEDDRSFGAWSYKTNSNDDHNDSSSSDPERERSNSLLADDTHTASLSESENESADKSFQCNVCKKWFSTIVTLKIHRRTHLNRGGGSSGRSRARSKDRYECDCCDMVFSRREKLWDHKAEAHRGAMTVRCEVCRKCFEDDSELAAHSKNHTQDEIAGICSKCGIKYPRYDQLRRHMAAAHGHGRSLPAAAAHSCTQCGKSFTHQHSLTRHLHNHAKQLYRCVVCKASFVHADQLEQHLNSHLANYKRLKP